MSATIFLKKQRIKVQTDEEHLGHQLRKTLNGPLQEELMAVMEKVFSQEYSTTTYLHIDKLTLDLGRMTLQTFGEQFIRLVELKMTKALQQHFQDGLDDNIRQDPPKNTNVDIGSHPSNGSFELRSAEQQELIALFYFLEKGIFPWWVQKNDGLLPSVLLDKIISEQGENMILKLIAFKNSHPEQILQSYLERLFVFLNPLKYEEVINLLVSQFNDPTIISNTSVLIQHRKEILKFIPFENYHRALFEFLLTLETVKQENLIYHFLKRLALKVSPLFNPSSDFAPTVMLDSEIKTAVKKIAEEFMGQKNGKNNGRFQKEKSALADKSMIEDAEIVEGIFIDNAGLVLLNPFLPSLFKQTKLLRDNNAFVSTDAQQKAAVLLYYLQSGELQYKEWEMAFNKVICGMQVQEVLQQDIIVSEEDQQLCDQLLEAVVHYWEALKGASINALRQTFLMRDGKLVWKEGYLSIQIERTGTDILLERLPWGYSTVKFPWLDKIIHTTW
jgi:hypothetical protein